MDFMEAVDTSECRDRNSTLFNLRDIPPNEVEVFAELLEAILQYDPSKRPGIREIVQHDWFKM